MKRTAIYMRVSTERQATDGQSLSFQRQILTEYINNHPELVLVGEYMDEGISGAKFEKRDELQRMLQDVKDGKIDLILFTKLDRFFRSVRHLMNTLDTLEQCGCEWKAIQENHDNTSPIGKLSITIMGAFAQMESDMDSQRIKDAMRYKKSKKEWPNWNVPFGYKIVDKHAVADPERAAVVRNLFREYIRHGNLTQLVCDHCADGAPQSWAGMKALLTNEAYIGVKYGIEGFTEPLIDKETFDRVQRLLAMNVKKSQAHTYIFSGLMICPICGHKMAATSIKGRWGQYRCRYKYINRCERARAYSEMKIEKYLLNNYKADLEQRYLALKEVKAEDNSQKINAIHRKIDRLNDLYINGLIEMDELKEKMNSFRSELNTLETPQDVHTEEIKALLEMNVYEIYQTLTKAQKRRLWRSVIRSITPKEDGTFFIEYL